MIEYDVEHLAANKQVLIGFSFSYENFLFELFPGYFWTESVKNKNYRS